MLGVFLIGLVMVLVTIGIHSWVTVRVRDLVHYKYRSFSKLRRLLHIDMIILIIILATVLESFVWACVYLYLGSFAALEDALYFSLVTFTTLGYGDLVLVGEYRMLGAIQSVNGVILLGWSTALVVGFIQKVYLSKSDKSISADK